MYKELQDIILATKKKFFSTLQGEHLSIFNANGLEFNETRQYTSGDDIRHINWKTTARTRNPSINLFFEHKKLQTSAVYLNSGSLAFGDKSSKKQVAIKILSTLSFLSKHYNDGFSTLFFDTKIQQFFPPTNDKYMIHRIYEYAQNLEPKGDLDKYNDLQEMVIKKIASKTILFFIGDFLEFPDFSKLQNSYEIYVFIIRDLAEEKLMLTGDTTLIDTNSFKKHNITLTNKTIKGYNEYMKNYDKKLFKIFQDYNINYSKFYTHEDLLSKLRDFLCKCDGR